MTESDPLSVELYRHDDGDTVRVIRARIGRDGSLQVGCQDIGGAPTRIWGDSDYEWWVSVAAEHKDRVLLLLLEQCFRRRADAVDEVTALLREHEIPCEWMNWT